MSFSAHLDARTETTRLWSTTLTRSVVLVADAGENVGLGHVSRSSAVAVALRCRGIDIRCFANGAPSPFECDGVQWVPFAEDRLPKGGRGVLIVDSYTRAPAELLAATDSMPLVVMHDFGEVPRDAAIVVAVATEPSPSEKGWLGGLAFAALRPLFWGLPERSVHDVARDILVTTGGGQLGEVGSDLARAIAEALPAATVSVVRGPQATFSVPVGVELVDAPSSLAGSLLAADLVVCAGGQTMLEAAACGTPCIALPLVDNQRGQANQLAAARAVNVVDPPDPSSVVAATCELVARAEVRRALSRNGQRAVDGFGALRVAYHVAHLLEERG